MKRKWHIRRTVLVVLLVFVPTLGLVGWITSNALRKQTQLQSLATLQEVGGEIYLPTNATLCGTDMDEIVSQTTAMGWLSGMSHLSQPFVVSCTHTNLSDLQLRDISKLDYLRGLNIEATRVTDLGLACLGRNCRRLEGLSIGGRDITDRGVASLMTLTKLKWLSADNSPVTDRALEYLCGNKALLSLSLNGTSVSNRSLLLITTQFPRLQTLRLCNTRVTDKGTAALRQLVDLKHLSLDGDDLGDIGAENPGKIASLTSLSVGNTHIGEKGIESISRVPRLETLNVSGIRLSRQMLDTILTIRPLRYLDIRNTGIREAEAAGIIRKAPELDVVYDWQPRSPGCGSEVSNGHRAANREKSETKNGTRPVR